MSYLVADQLRGGYGGADILNGCSLSVDKGEVAVIVGPNGAGKSTAMKALLGMLNLRQGSVSLGGKDITHMSPQDRVGQGIAFVPQTHNVFAGMTVEENLEMGAFLRTDDFTSTMSAFHIMVQGPTLTQRHAYHLTLGLFRSFTDRLGHLFRFTFAKTDTTFLVADHNQSSKAKALTTFYSFGYAVDRNQAISKFWSFFAFATIAPLVISLSHFGLLNCGRQTPYVCDVRRLVAPASSRRA